MSSRKSSSGKRPPAASGPSMQAAMVARHDAAMAFRSVIPCAAVFAAYFFVCMCFSTAAVPDISIFSLDFTHDQLKFRFWADAMTYPVVLGAVAFGAAMAFASFRFLLVKMQATTYLSLPVTRTRQYLTRLGASAVCMLVGIGVPLGVSLALNLAALGSWDSEFVQFAYILLGLFVCALVGFAAMSVALLLAGTQMEAILFAAALLASVTVACLGLNVLADWLLVGNAAGEYFVNTQHLVAKPLLAEFSSCNPLLFFADAAAEHQSFMVLHPVYAPSDPDWTLPLAWLVFSAAVLLAACLLYVGRHGERAGMAGLCTPMSFVFGLVCGLAVFAASFRALVAVNQAVAIAAGLVAFAVVSLLLLRGPLKGESISFRRSCAVLGGEAAVLVGVVAVIATGCFGWSAAVPADDEVASARVSYTGSPVWLVRGFESAAASNNGYYASGTYSYSDLADVAVVTQVHRMLVETGHAPLATDKFDMGHTVVPYDMEIAYTMKDGSTLTRYYDRATLDELAALLPLDDSKALTALRSLALTGDVSGLEGDAAQTIASSMTAQAFANGDIYVANTLLEEPLQLSCTPEARAELLAALAADVSAQSAADRYYPGKACRGVIMFSMDGANDVESFSYQMENSTVYLTDAFERTLAWLDEVGVSDGLSASAESVKKMSFETYDPYAGMNDASKTLRGQVFMAYLSPTSDDFMTAPDFGRRFETDERDQIDELFPLLRATYFLNGGGYQVCCELENGKNAYLFVPYEIAPDWLIRQVGKA